jgi:hypothetical protein
MFVSKPGWPLFAVFVVAASTAACVPSRYPLSDEATSRGDEQLIGRWTMDDETYVVRMRPGMENTLELDHLVNGKEAGQASTIYTTVIGPHRYLSAETTERGGETAYTIARYELAGHDTLKVRLMDAEVLAKTIIGKRLAGTVKVLKDQPTKDGHTGLSFVTPLLKSLVGQEAEQAAIAGPAPLERTTFDVRLADSPRQLARYLDEHGDACFPDDEEHVLVFQRTP